MNETTEQESYVLMPAGHVYVGTLERAKELARKDSKLCQYAYETWVQDDGYEDSAILARFRHGYEVMAGGKDKP